MRIRPSALAAALLLTVLAPLSTARATAQAEQAPAAAPADQEPAPAGGSETAQEAAKAQVSIDAVKVTPEKPGPETLCRLTVTLHNRGERAMTAFAFDVSVAGHPLPVYTNQLFLKALGPGETLDLALYNFWTSETGRPAPADGKMPVEVTLREARWLTTGDEDGTEVWKLEGPVGGLPVSGKTVVTLSK